MVWGVGQVPGGKETSWDRGESKTLHCTPLYIAWIEDPYGYMTSSKNKISMFLQCFQEDTHMF